MKIERVEVKNKLGALQSTQNEKTKSRLIENKFGTFEIFSSYSRLRGKLD